MRCDPGLYFSGISLHTTVCLPPLGKVQPTGCHLVTSAGKGEQCSLLRIVGKTVENIKLGLLILKALELYEHVNHSLDRNQDACHVNEIFMADCVYGVITKATSLFIITLIQFSKQRTVMLCLK